MTDSSGDVGRKQFMPRIFIGRFERGGCGWYSQICILNITLKLVQRLDGDGGKRGLTASHSMAVAQKTEEPGWAKVCGGGRVRTAGFCSPEVTSSR